ncbi:MAG: metallophosphoesterase [Oscillospiraceae bacterium]|nr:metallophosphoesterase [Oscillospiraceae bacterium]
MNRKTSMFAASAAFGTAFPKVYSEMSAPEVSHYNINSQLLPKNFYGFKIVHLSDLHNKVFGKNNAPLLNLIESEQPDIIVMTGDMISHKAPYTDQFLTLVQNMRKLCPVYYVNGNHELSDIDSEEFNRVTEKMAEYGAVCLDNTSVEIHRGNEHIRICGLCYTAEYYRGVREYKRGWKAFMLTDMIDYMGVKQPDEYTILLAHNPLDFDVHAEWGADISFGGHVHGGLIRLPIVKGIFSPERRFFPKYKEGVYQVGSSFLVASRGLGKIRINNPPEVVSVTLNKK